MAKTLADMTPEERRECVGMWATPTHCRGNDGAVVIAAIVAGAAYVYRTKDVGWGEEVSVIPLNHITPRHDLPRVWTPEGKPVEMEVEFAESHTYSKDGRKAFWRITEEEAQELPQAPGFGEHIHLMRRFATEWEEIPAQESDSKETADRGQDSTIKHWAMRQ